MASGGSPCANPGSLLVCLVWFVARRQGGLRQVVRSTGASCACACARDIHRRWVRGQCAWAVLEAAGSLQGPCVPSCNSTEVQYACTKMKHPTSPNHCSSVSTSPEAVLCCVACCLCCVVLWMQVLDVSGNPLGALPPFLSRLQALNKLGLASTLLLALPGAISSLTNLQHLSVASNKLQVCSVGIRF